MVYAHVWGACGEIRAGSSPAYDTIKKTMTFVIVFFIRRLVRALICFAGEAGVFLYGVIKSRKQNIDLQLIASVQDKFCLRHN